jgi:hypothetical protein
MYSLQYRAGNVHIIQLENCWMDLYEIWYGYYAIGDYPKIFLQFSTVGNMNMADEQTCEVGSTLAPLAIGPYNDVWLQIFRQYNINNMAAA